MSFRLLTGQAAGRAARPFWSERAAHSWVTLSRLGRHEDSVALRYRIASEPSNDALQADVQGIVTGGGELRRYCMSSRAIGGVNDRRLQIAALNRSSGLPRARQLRGLYT